MALHHFISHYGLYAVFAGCFMEGESFAVTGGFFAHQGAFPVLVAMGVAAVGAFLGDTALFALGRRFSSTDYVQRKLALPVTTKAMALLERHQTLFILTNRFIYGMRTVGGLAVGLSSVSALRFMVLNAISAVVWAFVFVGGGYLFGASAQAVFGRMLHEHERALIAIAIVGAGALAVHLWLRKRSFRA